MYHRGKNDSADPGAFRDVDHLRTDGGFVFDERWSDVEHGVHSIQCGSQVLAIREITDHRIGGAGSQDGVSLLRMLNESADVDAALREFRYHEACERTGSSDCENAACRP